MTRKLWPELVEKILFSGAICAAAGLACAPSSGAWERVGNGPWIEPGPESGKAVGAPRPRSAGRKAAAFDFDAVTPYDVPDHWNRAQDPGDGSRAGYPQTNLAVLDETMAKSGRTSVALPTRGGSTSLVLEAGMIPVFGDADYRVTAWVRTGGLRHARGVVVARLLDRKGVVIAGGEKTSEPTISEGAWREVSVEVSGRTTSAGSGEGVEAAYLQLELRLEQPREAMGKAAPKHESVNEDFSGTVWFDDVTVVQLARIDLTTDEPGDVFVGRPVKLRALIRDLTSEEMSARVTVVDLYGRAVDRFEKPVGSGRVEMEVEPRVDRYGWYRAVLEVLSAGEVVGVAKADFVSTPAARDFGGLSMPASLDAARLGLVIDDFKPMQVPRMVPLIETLGVGAVTVPVWTTDLTREGVLERAKSLSGLIESASVASREVTLALAEPPGDAVPAHKLDRADPWAVLREDKAVWWPYLDQFLDRYGQRVRRWQIGATGSQTAAWRADLSGDLDRLDGLFSQLVAGPVFVVPSRIEYSATGAFSSKRERSSAVTSAVGADLSSEAVYAAVLEQTTNWTGDPGSNHTYVFERPDEGSVGLGAGVDDVCRKTVELWAASGSGDARTRIRAAVQQPWVYEAGRLRVKPEFAAWRTLVDQLTGRVVVGEFPVVNGVKCYILGPAPGAPLGRGGALVAWNATAAPEDAVIEAHLGSGELTLVDRFGNRTRLQEATQETVVSPGAVVVGGTTRGEDDAIAPTVRVKVGSSPVFIEGIDVELAKFVASVSIKPGFLTSTTQRQDASVEFVNPWPVPITGQIAIVEPIGSAVSGDGLDRSWKIVPRVIRFSAAAGSRVSLPMSIAFGGLEEAGRKRFVLLADVNADRRAKGVRIVTGVNIGLENLKLELTASRSPTVDGPDAVVEVRVTNLGNTMVDAELTAFAPKLPRASATVTSLRAGHQTVRRFVFTGAAEMLRGQRVILSINDPEAGTRLNASAIMP